MARPPKAAKPEIKHSGPVDITMFTDDELKQYQAEAEADFRLERKTAAIEAFKEAEKERLRKEEMFKAGVDAEGEDVLEVIVDLAPHAPWITIDGRVYYHGIAYKFTPAQARTINEICFRTWQHEREVGGANMNAENGRTHYRSSLSPNKAA